MARGSFRFLVSGEMKKYPRNEQLKPMQLSVQTESSDNKSPLSLGRICNWFLPRRNYPFSSSLMRILDYEILTLKLIAQRETRASTFFEEDGSFQFWSISYSNSCFSFFLFSPLSVSRLYVPRAPLRSKFIKPIHAHVRFFFSFFLFGVALITSTSRRISH